MLRRGCCVAVKPARGDTLPALQLSRERSHPLKQYRHLATAVRAPANPASSLVLHKDRIMAILVIEPVSRRGVDTAGVSQ